jgi:hypothetical protein
MGSHGLTLAQAAMALCDADAALVALAGPWPDVLDASLSRAGAGGPIVADLSAPPAIPGPVRARLGRRLATLQELSRWGLSADPLTAAYVRHADALIEAALLQGHTSASQDGR